MTMPVFEASAPPTDTFLNRQTCIDRLIDDYKEHGHLVVAYDFDDTVYDKGSGSSCRQVVELLRECSRISTIDLVVFTARNPVDYGLIKDYCQSEHIRIDAINENVSRLKGDFGSGFQSKIFYNIFLDDRAGLYAAYETLVGFLKWYYHQEGGDE